MREEEKAARKPKEKTKGDEKERWRKREEGWGRKREERVEGRRVSDQLPPKKRRLKKRRARVEREREIFL